MEQEQVEEKNEKLAPLEEVQVHEIEIVENKENSINHVTTRKRWNQNEVIVDNVFAYAVAAADINENKDLKPKSVEQHRHKCDWPK